MKKFENSLQRPRTSAKWLAPPIAAVAVLGVAQVALAASNVFLRQANMADNVVRNGCGSATVTKVGSTVTFLGDTRTRSGAQGSCATPTNSPAQYLQAVVYGYVDGAYVGGNEGWNSGAASLESVSFGIASLSGLHTYATESYPGWYKGANCQAGDACSNGYTTNSLTTASITA